MGIHSRTQRQTGQMAASVQGDARCFRCRQFVDLNTVTVMRSPNRAARVVVICRDCRTQVKEDNDGR